METATRSRLFACQQTQRATKLLMRCQWLHELLVQVRAPGGSLLGRAQLQKNGEEKKKKPPVAAQYTGRGMAQPTLVTALPRWVLSPCSFWDSRRGVPRDLLSDGSPGPALLHFFWEAADSI